MKARYIVYEQLKNMTETKQQNTTQEIADAANLSRNVVTTYLSQLLKEGLVGKTNGRPVYWSISNINEGSFSKLIGSQGSLRELVEECKAAVNYPPDGFPLIITGESGVGKSFLATLIYNYAVDEQIISDSSRFISLNCADYANNPELLSSVLFGYRKGAFTGALHDTEGLIKQADGGFLFLDEVHRLNSENQEKLFTLLDSGSYYPLGEKDQAVHVKVRCLFATTESLDDNLLLTFRRRVPMNVWLPPFSKRPINERLQIIFSCFNQEAKKLAKKILIEPQTVTKLLKEDHIGNIGDIKNKVQLLCAKAYNQQKEDVIIQIGNHEIEDSNSFKAIELPKAEMELSKIVHSFFTLSNSLGVSIQSNKDFLEYRHFFKTYLTKNRKIIFSGGVDPFYHFYSMILKDSITWLQRKYGILNNVDEEDFFNTVVALCISEFIQIDPDFIWDLKKIEQLYPRTVYLSNKMCDFLEQQLDISKDQRTILSILFVYTLFADDVKNIEDIDPLCILLSHGTMATSIQSIANELCQHYIFEAFDMPIDVSINEISTEVIEFIRDQKKNYQEVIILFDMGSLSQMYRKVKEQADINLLLINNLTTSMALDIGLLVQQRQAFKEIAIRSETYGQMTNTQYYEGISISKNIIVSCMSGVGVSEAIKDILQESLSVNTEIITMDYQDLIHNLDSHDSDYFKNTQLILTTTDILNANEQSILNVYDVLENQGANKFKALLQESGEKLEACEVVLEKLVQFFSIGGIEKRLRFLNPAIVISEAITVVEKYEQYYEINLSGRDKLNLYMHISLMIERVLTSSVSEADSTVDVTTLDDERREFYSISKSIFQPLEINYNINIDFYEISLLFSLIKK